MTRPQPLSSLAVTPDRNRHIILCIAHPSFLRTWCTQIAVVAAVLAASAGCDRRLKPVPVSGVVTFDGKPPPASGSVYFTPIGTKIEGSVARPGVGDFGADGKFDVTCVSKGDGLWPGSYRTHVDCWKVPATAFAPPSGSCLPPNFSSPDLVVPHHSNHPIKVDYDVR